MQAFDIKTTRLGLRLLQMNDLDLIATLHADPEVRKYYPGGTLTREQTEIRMEELISYNAGLGLPNFVMFDLQTGEFVGRCGFGPLESGEIEVGYLIQQKLWNQGYASEALRSLLDWAKKNINTEYVIALTPNEHVASQRVMQKCGMSQYKNEMAYGVPCVFYRIKNR